MCGILVHKGKGNNFFIQKRGQDLTTEFERNGLTFVHNLLSITGEFTPQPFVKDEIVCLYNGEIYNQPFIKSDGECLIPLYEKYGDGFADELDGEYAIALYDFKKDIALFITDLFSTKPLWRNCLECGSYESGIGGHKIKANTIEIVKISTGELLETKKYHKWDFNQYKKSYDDCLKSLEKAVLKRYKQNCFIGLSSGYDSGVIASILKGKDFKCYTIIGSENKEIIKKRTELVDVEIINNLHIEKNINHLKENAEEFFYNIEYRSGTYKESYKKDRASIGLSEICRRANKEGRRVYLSGSGADEIISDYSLLPNQSEFLGKFPKELKEWTNFTGSCMYSYLGKEECVGGSWNIETRYPFLDKEFVQEFLWLDSELKNRNYKSVLFEQLTKTNFPFQRNVKTGFTI